jgi:ASC-1-like (ASCH) protein
MGSIKPELTMTHSLKTVNPYFEAVWQGLKTFEVRENDRDYKVGDLLCLKEWDHKGERYTGRETTVEITYILDDFREVIRSGYVVIGFKIKSKFPLLTT